LDPQAEQILSSRALTAPQAGHSFCERVTAEAFWDTPAPRPRIRSCQARSRHRVRTGFKPISFPARATNSIQLYWSFLSMERIEG
jgi:hypothetical protein